MVPTASFYFWNDTEVRTKYYEYKAEKLGSPGSEIQYFNLRKIEPGVSIPPQKYPLIWKIMYPGNTVSAQCASSPETPTNATQECLQGSFTEEPNLSLILTDIRTNITTKLRAKESWVNKKEAPRFILRDVLPNDSLGGIAVKTVFTKPGDCTKLKICLGREPGLDMLATLGLALLIHDIHSYNCTLP